ncbi:putative uncharacterized protein DDB_G0271982 isoform X2 [Ostrea edulis]|uniref:putative uncharacterized protein DDB_G0271982 isoform X2 n=1 Tax=Ostrea edulis TaxID=37623 RepID=UPI0024AF7FB6|nr:putative uncharacterized protein DDB_G0271982 isoform X2 [Ostrea edulis]
MYDPEFPLVMLVFETLSCLPPTSVSCETTFSQMKLIKTSRRTRLRNTTLNNLLLIKLESPNVADYTPDKAVEKRMNASVMPRRPTYSRKLKADVVDLTKELETDIQQEEREREKSRRRERQERERQKSRRERETEEQEERETEQEIETEQQSMNETESDTEQFRFFLSKI